MTDDTNPVKQEAEMVPDHGINPSNELLDGDDKPSAEDLADPNVQVDPSGTRLESAVRPDEIPPPASANLELRQRVEKTAQGMRESVGDVDDPEQDPTVAALLRERSMARDDGHRDQIDHELKQRGYTHKAADDGDDAEGKAAGEKRAAAGTEKTAAPKGRTSRGKQTS
jgi:hypothetical protein